MAAAAVRWLPPRLLHVCSLCAPLPVQHPGKLLGMEQGGLLSHLKLLRTSEVSDLTRSSGTSLTAAPHSGQALSCLSTSVPAVPSAPDLGPAHWSHLKRGSHLSTCFVLTFVSCYSGLWCDAVISPFPAVSDQPQAGPTVSAPWLLLFWCLLAAGATVCTGQREKGWSQHWVAVRTVPQTLTLGLLTSHSPELMSSSWEVRATAGWQQVP